jgi:uncharacterized protein
VAATPTLADKLHGLEKLLAGMESLLIAFSGGVDSTLLLRVTSGIPGIRHLALTTDSPTNTAEEIMEARRLAAQFGSPHRVVAVDELSTPGYAANPDNRCYLCKQTLYPLCFDTARHQGLAWVADGVNLDDLSDYRPGLAAAAEMGVRHPLVEAGLTKGEVRRLSARLGLPTADRPASPCLSSRFPYGTRITRQRLAQVARAEAVMRAFGFVELRVRHLGAGARVEVSRPELPRLTDPGLRAKVRERLEKEGFSKVEISAEPLRSGSLNDRLVDGGGRTAP